MWQTALATGIESDNYFGRLASKFATEKLRRDYGDTDFDNDAHKGFRNYYEFAMAEFKEQRLKLDMNSPATEFTEILNSIITGNLREDFDACFERVRLILENKYEEVSVAIEEARKAILTYRVSKAYHLSEAGRRCTSANKECVPKITDRAEHLELDFRMDASSFVYHFCKHGQEIAKATMGCEENFTPQDYLENAQLVVRNDHHVPSSKFKFEEFRQLYTDAYDDELEDWDCGLKMKHFVMVDKAECSHFLASYYMKSEEMLSSKNGV